MKKTIYKKDTKDKIRFLELEVKFDLFLVLILNLFLVRLGKFIFLDKSFCKFKLLVLSKSLLFCIINLLFL